MTDKEYWQARYEAAKARDINNADKFTENPYKRVSDADDLKAEIKHLNTIVERLDEFEKCRKCLAWSGTDCTRNPYTEGCLDDKVNLKNEIKRLEKENEQLKAKLEARLTCNFVKTAQTHAVQDFADKLKEKLFSVFGKTICSDLDTEDITDIIDELLKEYEK